MTVHRWRSAVRPITDTLFAVAVLGALVVPGFGGGERLLANLPLVIAFAFVLFRLQGQVGVLGEAVSTLAEQSGVGTNVLALLENSRSEADGSATVGASVEQVQADQVVFGYGGASVLRGLDLDANAGEIVAVVGASGAGKSTLVQLLLRLRLPESGTISLDRAPLGSLRRMALAENIGVVFEDCFLFDESVEWNITLGRHFSPAQVQAAVSMAELDDVVRSLPGASQFRVGPRGRNLSAGQRQRVVLARAVIARPQILILDEATNALDAPTEQSLLRRLREARPEGITLVIAHRLSTVLAADRIVVLEGGRFAGVGRHAELLEGNETYRQLVETQLIDSPAQRA
jgi:ABC-type multidrug transport system fused ATPase/permease subunit